MFVTASVPPGRRETPPQVVFEARRCELRVPVDEGGGGEGGVPQGGGGVHLGETHGGSESVGAHLLLSLELASAISPGGSDWTPHPRGYLLRLLKVDETPWERLGKKMKTSASPSSEPHTSSRPSNLTLAPQTEPRPSPAPPNSSSTP